MSKWGYGKDDGPDTWYKYFPIAKGEHQSPINIVPKKAAWDASLNYDPLIISYKTENNMEIFNSGHSVQAKAKETSVISRGPLESTYQLAQFHFHWGSDNCKGSEHIIDGRSYAAELHLVHWNTELFKTFNDALADPRGLAVLGVFIKEGTEHRELKLLSDKMKSVQFKNQTSNIASFDPRCLLPVNTSRYWTYSGSLTTPPLCECVTWIVFEQSIEVSHKQMEAFRVMVGDEQHCNNNTSAMSDNFRPPMPMCERVVMASFKKTM